MEKQSSPPKKQGDRVSSKEEITSPTQILPDKAVDEMPEIVGQTPMPDTVGEKVTLEKVEEETTIPMPARDETTSREDITPTAEEEMVPAAEEITLKTPIAVPTPDITPATGEEMPLTAPMPTGEEMLLTGEEMLPTAPMSTGEEMPPTGKEMPPTGKEMPPTAATVIAEEITLTGEEMPPTAGMLTAEEITPTGEEMPTAAVTLTAGALQIRTETRIPTIATENIRIRSSEIQTETTRGGTLPRTKQDHVVVDISQQAKTEAPAPLGEEEVSKLTLNATFLGAASTAFFGVDQHNYLNFLGLAYLVFFASAVLLLMLGKIRRSRNLMIWGTHATHVTTLLAIVLICIAAAFARK